MFSLASKILSTIATPAFEKAYEKGRSIWEAKDELRKLRRSIQTIQAVLLDAEKKQESSAAVKDWVDRVRDVLYDADDLFDEVATDEMLKKQISKEGKPLKKVRAYCFKLNPIVSRNSIANQVKAIRKRLLEISTDMEGFQFVKSVYEQPISGSSKRQESGSFVDSKEVIGREEDKKAILEMLLHDQSNDDVLVIAIVGIGGMGKTTVAQLVYNDEEVKKYFENRWFACISDISDEREVVGKIFQSICEKNYDDFTLSQLQIEIKKSVEKKKFLLVLDDVWDNDHGKWIDRMGLLSGCAKGSKIIVTTRSKAVASAVGAIRLTHTLDGLSEDESWALFKRIAFTSERENDSRWIDLGRDIMKKCANVPLAIKSIGSLLHAKATIQEWESIMKEQLTKVEESGRVSVISVLKLSYDHLHSNLKQCFAYCSLFPKDYEFDKQDLIYLWIAQGYIKPNSKEQTLKEVGHSYFMDLFRMSFFQEEEYDNVGEITECKMHDLIHDLAQQVAAEETITLTTSITESKGTPRHANVGCIAGDSSANLTLLQNDNRLRSLLFIDVDSTRGLDLDQEFAKLKFLRALKLSGLGIENVPSSIGGLKLLRYLDLSRNKFRRLPDSVTELLNLCTLDLSQCFRLEALPNDLRKLVNLRDLKIKDCENLRYVPPGFGELASLQHLDWFYVGGGMGQGNKLGDLFGLKISGNLFVRFGGNSDKDDWDGFECWKPLVNLQGLQIEYYKGMRIPHWANGRSADSPSLLLPNLKKLSLCCCNGVKCLPPFKHLPNLEILNLFNMRELEYIEEEEEEENGGKQNLTARSDALFLPSLNELELAMLPKLKGWSRKVEAAMTSKEDVTAKGEEHFSSTSAISCPKLPSFPSLSKLSILDCKQIKYMPLCPSLRYLVLMVVDGKVIPPSLSIRDHFSPSTSTSSILESVVINSCDGLTSFPGRSLTSLRHLEIIGCENLKRVELPPAHLNILELLKIWLCEELELWEEEKRGVDWDSLPNLRQAIIYLPRLRQAIIPSPERLPECLQKLQSLGKLEII